MMAAAYQPYIMRDPSTQTYKRGVAQPGSAPPWGGGGRRFKSSRPDHSYTFAPIEVVIPQEQFAGARYPVTTFSRAGFARVFTCGWLTHGRLLFFACAKKSNQKKHTPERSPLLKTKSGSLRSSPHRALDQLAWRTQRASGSNTVSLNYSRWDCGTRRALRGVEQPTSICGAGVLFQPVWRARASQPESGLSRASCLSPRRVFCARRVEARADSGEKHRGYSRHPGVLSLVSFFARAKKETRPRCGEPQSIRRRRRLYCM